MNDTHAASVARAVQFFGYDNVAHWTVRRAEQLAGDDIRGHVVSKTVGLDHETSPSRSWMQANNGVYELLATMVVGEIEDAR